MPRFAKKGKKSSGKGTLFRKKHFSKSLKSIVQAGRVRGTLTRQPLYDVVPIDNVRQQYGPLVSFPGFPNRLRTMLRYAEAFPPAGLSVGAAGVGGSELVYALNNLFDPNVTLPGHQPYEFDQIVGLGYQRYRVDRVSVRIQVFDPSSTGTVLVWAYQAWNSSSGSMTGISWNSAAERDKSGTLSPELGSERKTICHDHLPMWQIQGMTQREYTSNVEDYSAVVTTSPARSPYLRICAFNQTGSNSGTIYGSVEFIFEAEFFDRQTVASS